MTARRVKALYKATLHVSPAPDSLIYTSPIFQKLKTFGDVVSFKKIRSPSPYQHSGLARPLTARLFQVAFTNESDLNRALIASPFSVNVDHDLPSPRAIDPYNIFGLQSRKQPEPRSFACELKRSEDQIHFHATSFGSVTGDETPQKVKLVKDERTGPLYKSLLEAGVPLGQLEGLATVIEPVSDGKESVERTSSKAEALPGSPSLAEMYRTGLKRGVSLQNSPEEPTEKGAEEVQWKLALPRKPVADPLEETLTPIRITREYRRPKG